MRRLILVLAGVAAISGCSDLRERRSPTTDNSAQRPDLTLPDTTRLDTSVALSSRVQQPVSPVEQLVTRSESRPAKARPVPKRRNRPARRVVIPVDTFTRAYAPNALADTAASGHIVARDTAGSRPTDTARTSVDSQAARTLDTAVQDTVLTRPTDTAGTNADSVAARLPDTVAARVPDTVAIVAADTNVSPAAAGVTAAGVRTLPIGTEIHTALDDSITSRRDTVGRTVSAHVMQNVRGSDGRTLIAAGTPVRFTVTRLRAARSKGSQGRLALGVDGIALNGQLQPVQAEVGPVPRELRGRGVTGSEAAKVGGGAAAGAVLGRVVGGNTRGAVIGGVAGAAAGAVVAGQTATRDVVVKAKTPVVLVLTAPLVTP
jgi:hypothetical protein